MSKIDKKKTTWTVSPTKKKAIILIVQAFVAADPTNEVTMSMNERQNRPISIQIQNLVTLLSIAPSTLIAHVTGKAVRRSTLLMQDKIMATGWFIKPLLRRLN